MSAPVLIIGGGISGLTTALALLRAGVRIAVFEQARALGEVGAGISLGPTASRGLYALGLERPLRAVADIPPPSAALHYATGEVLGGSFADRDWRRQDTSSSNQIHRADLIDLLRDAVLAEDPDALRLACSLRGFTQDADGVTAQFGDGTTCRGSALIGCDGIRSTVRAELFGAEHPLLTGWVAYRFLVPIEAARPYMSRAGTFVGPGRSLLRYAVRKGTLVNCVTFARSESWTGEGWSERVSTTELLALFEGWHPDVLGLARHAPPEGTAKWALYDRDPLPVWVRGRVALLGDAAHPMLPFLGLGAATAIEDAVVLGRAFAADPVEPALQRYQRARVERANTMLLESRRQGEIYRDGPGGTGRTRMSTAERADYDPATAPL